MKYHNQIIKVAAVVISIVGLVDSSWAQTRTVWKTVTAEGTITPPSVKPIPLPRVIPTPTPKPTPVPPPSTSYVKLNITHQTQEYMLCVPTSASMMASKTGWNYPPRQIKLATLGLRWYGPTTAFSYWTPMSLFELSIGLRYLNINSWRSESYAISDFQRGLDDIKDSLRKGFPVMIVVWYSTSIGHAMVVTGYDDRNQTLIMNDPGMRSPGLAYYTYNSLRDNYWKNRYNQRWVVFMNQKSATASASIMLANPSSNNTKDPGLHLKF